MPLLESMKSWLVMEDELRGRVSVCSTIGKGDLGTGIDLLSVVVGSGGAATVLISSISAWLQQPRKSDVVVKVTTSDGKSIEIDAKRVTTLEAQELLRNAFEADQREGT
ncbi:effector-associated constant component EACC1 [Streptomyces xylophagus]|uniref:effector-associated constant component EACC1 n=1 Tax=Streptomyces xylophagus TaxID=285514 RepID=UPI00227710C3|nr:hypothetical protein [Streptomyces xylophagus]